MRAWASRVERLTRTLRWVRWVPPEQGEFALNTDGAVKQSRLASAGGLIRDSNGAWVGGFLVNIGVTSVLHAELVGVREGLKLAQALGIGRLVVQVDSSLAVLLLN